uniref:Uncharacterized protein n=1 Tax=Rhizophora mucronata TaxID=61149 RepID=A0A2P2QFB8_RHIMU
MTLRHGGLVNSWISLTGKRKKVANEHQRCITTTNKWALI